MRGLPQNSANHKQEVNRLAASKQHTSKVNTVQLLYTKETILGQSSVWAGHL